MTLDLDHLNRWAGRVQVVDEELCAFPARALSAVLDRDAAFTDGEALPPCWHWLYFLDTPRSASIGPDGHARKGDFLPPVPLARRMWAGGALRFDRPLHLGRRTTRRSMIRAVEHKRGRSGELVFVIVDHEITQGGEVCVREEQTLVYRALSGQASATADGEPAAAAEWTSIVHPDSATLFRFSALTFNAHRIHYDHRYATSEEGYPGLVVHGPLLVLWLLELLARHAPTQTLTRLRFRAVRPTFDRAPIRLQGRRAGPHVELWSADDGHLVGMRAAAQLAEAP